MRGFVSYFKGVSRDLKRCQNPAQKKLSNENE